MNQTVTYLQELTAIPSPTGFTREIADYLVKTIEGFGYEVTRTAKGGVNVTVPKTVVLCTDIFDTFMESNNLYQIALSDISDEEILEHFLKAKLPEELKPDFLAFFDVVGKPIAVRSSSLLEDSHYQPFAGIYSTLSLIHI